MFIFKLSLLFLTKITKFRLNQNMSSISIIF